MRALLLFALMLPAVAFAEPSVNIAWNGCAPTNPPQNIGLADGSSPTLVVTGHGFSGPIRAIQIKVRVSHAGYAGLPDSWRYDPAGCSSGGFSASYASAGCPAIVGTTPLAIVRYDYDNVYGTATLAYVFEPWTPNPSTTYTLAQFTFDKSRVFRGPGAKPDSCGCGDSPEALSILEASWLDPATTTVHPMVLESEFVSWEDPDHSAYCSTDCLPPSSPEPCSLPTPASLRSWGSVKSQYR